MVARKSLETMSCMSLNQLQPKFSAKTVANDTGASYVGTAMDSGYACCRNYRILVLNISKFSVTFQVLSNISEGDELLDEHWAKFLQSENISTPMSPIYVQCNMRISHVSDYKKWYMTRCISHVCEIRRVTYHFFSGKLLRTYGLVVKASSSKSSYMGSIPAECWHPLLVYDQRRKR